MRGTLSGDDFPVMYKGYEICKIWYTDEQTGKRIPGTIRYIVADMEDYLSEEFKTEKEARKYIDRIEEE